MGPIDPAGQEKRLVVLRGQLGADPLGDLEVTSEFLVAHLEGMPVGFHVLPVTGPGQALRPLSPGHVRRKGVLRLLLRVVVVPGLRIDEVVEDLAGSPRPIAVPREVFRHQLRLRQDRAHLLQVGVKPRAERGQPRHDGGAGRVAGSGGTMRVCEQDPLPRQTVEMGRSGLRVTAQAPYPVVQVIERDEQDIGPARHGRRKDARQQQEQKHETSHHVSPSRPPAPRHGANKPSALPGCRVS